ncbi:LPS-assembly protein LptD [Legionella fairfieldensis]|uniref:LPS-assembly protein LptD n=1 Tax=Legionella fairfieldensis TaxID=45064 RepID=UPI0005679940|nr:LPS-assembly protein LptD [Legionella fairfieldensis]
MMAGMYQVMSHAAEIMAEPVQACVIARNVELTAAVRSRFARCLGWQDDTSYSLCKGSYQVPDITPLPDDEVRIMANEVSFYNEGRSKLSGNVEVHQTDRVVNAQTAYVYRDAKTNQVKQIELLGEVRYLEADKLLIARKAIINPQDKSGKVEDVLYRVNSPKRGAVLPAWGRASLVERFANKNYLLRQATYTTCAPQDKAWQIEADSIILDDANATGVARNAKLRIANWPVFYTPYLTFPTSKARKSGFLMPVIGSSNVGGFDLALPYYWNMAPNYDATIIPHLYSRRGLMMGGQFRYLTRNSLGIINGRFLPHDRVYSNFLQNNVMLYPQLQGKSSDRWSFQVQNSTVLNPDLHLGVDVQQVSDDYFLQDFSSNLAILTQRQLLRQGDLTYTTPHWLFRGMVQSYQTLHPLNETPIENVYQRLPQLMASGAYDELPFNGNFALLGQFDYFQWPDSSLFRPQGPRYHLNPVLSFPQMKPWGFFTPTVEFVESYYEVHREVFRRESQFNRAIPRYNIDSGLYFERQTSYAGKAFTQTLEPRLYYLRVPFHNQTPIPVYDSAYMIFNADQLFRTNRFSGFDRIGDANQLSYAVSSRWLSDATGSEKASVTVGQIRYFANRRVQLCQSSISPYCWDNPLFLGYLSPLAKSSPFVTRGVYHFNPAWIVTGDYAWDPYTRGTNNGHVNFHYQPGQNKIVEIGYTYLVNGDITKVAYSNIENNPLHQGTFAYAWPFNANWSTLGAYNYNISKRYEMMSFFGVQYDSCCWALRLLGGRAFRSLNSELQPRYNNNVYLQVLLKGLGSAGTSDPSSRILTFLPGYVDSFRH